MTIEVALIAVIVLLALVPLMLQMDRRIARAVALGVIVLGAGVSAITAARPRVVAMGEAAVGHRPIEVAEEGYVTSRTCQACHPHEYDTWHGSYHRTMTQVATPDAVVAPFDGVVLRGYGRVFRLERRGDTYWAEMDDPDAIAQDGVRPRRVRRQIVLTTGAHHEQDFWYETDAGRRVGRFPFVYRVTEQQWIPDISVLLTDPASPWGFGQWNLDCIRCHTTDGRPRPRGEHSMDTHVAEFGIACEACHGPAEAHVRANRNPQRRYDRHLGDDPDETIVNPARLSASRASEACGQCHGVTNLPTDDAQADWLEHGYPFRPGANLADTRHIVRNTADDRQVPLMQRTLADTPTFYDERFWSDGMVRPSGRDYSGMIESPCYKTDDASRRLSCLSCHVMHKSKSDSRSLTAWADDQLKPGLDEDDLVDRTESNEACLQCHESYRKDPASHAHHAPESSGSRCYNCHMSYTTYGLLKAIRSHHIDTPSVQTSLDTGRPNACSQCHLDKTLAWVADALEDWYDIPKPDLDADERSISAAVLWTLRGDAAQRALMAWSLGWDEAREVAGTRWMPPYLAQLMADPYDAVRFIAHRSLGRLPGFEDFAFDFVAPEAERIAGVERVMQMWRGTGATVEAADRNAVLLDADGNLEQATFDRLLAERNHRPVFVAE